MLHFVRFPPYDIVDKAKPGDTNTINGWRWLRGGRGMKRCDTKDVYGNETALYTTVMETGHYVFVHNQTM